MNSVDRSYEPVSISSRIGRAKESPTICKKLIFSRSMTREDVLRVERAHLVLDHDGVATVHREERDPVSGAVHERRSRHDPQRPRLAASTTDSSDSCGAPVDSATHHRHVDVVLAPQDAFRHARRSARVQHVEIVRRPLGRARGERRRRARECVLVPRGAFEQVVVRFVGHLEEQRHPGEIG